MDVFPGPPMNLPLPEALHAAERAAAVLLMRSFVRLAWLTAGFLSLLTLVHLAVPREPLAMGLITAGQAVAVTLVAWISSHLRPSTTRVDQAWGLLILTWAIPLLLRATLDDSTHHLYLFLPVFVLSGVLQRHWLPSLLFRLLLLTLFVITWHLTHPVQQRASSLALNATFYMAFGVWIQHLMVRFRTRILARMARLASARREIVTLEGLVPICMHCKQVRNDQGFWEQVEAFFRRRHRTDFTHGLCPRCLEEMKREVEP